MGLAAFDGELAAEGVQRIRPKGERTPREDQRVYPLDPLELHAGALELRREEANVPNGRVGDEDRPVEEREYVTSDALEARGTGDLGRVDPVDVRRAAHPLAGVEERTDEARALAADDPLDADLDDPVADGVEPRHLEVDEHERRL